MLQVMELSWCGRSIEVLSNLLSLANVDRACVDTVPHRGSDIDESGQRYLAQPVEFVRGHGDVHACNPRHVEPFVSSGFY